MSKCACKFVYAETKYHYTVTHSGHTSYMNVFVRGGEIVEWDGLHGHEWDDFDDTELTNMIMLDLQKKELIK